MKVYEQDQKLDLFWFRFIDSPIQVYSGALSEAESMEIRFLNETTLQINGEIYQVTK